LIRVDDPLRALERIGVAARARLSPDARVIAVTGSVGKTGTKEMLRACLGRVGKTHAAVKSFNNHWGVPLTLARTPADVAFAVYEIGMNHAGEITPLTRMLRPHVAIVTTVEPVHLASFDSIEGIADAKAEIFGGLVAGGTAIINRDNPHFERLQAAAKVASARIVSFGRHQGSNVRIVDAQLRADGSAVTIARHGRNVTYSLGAPGAHLVQNSGAVVAALDAVDADLGKALPALHEAAAPEGRGARTQLTTPTGPLLLIDESYNANPASMRAALATLGTVPREDFPRRIAVLGDMLELGADSPALHRGLADAIEAAGVDLLFACGPDMRHLFEDIAPSRRGAWAPDSAALQDLLLTALAGGDVVMIKGSLGSRMALLVQAMKDRFPGGT
jgi:UDP-N-acetylmuramoyl-tripeptide--D-alanyl-D-alanine ligase